MRRIVIPYTASVNCAFGLVTAVSATNIRRRRRCPRMCHRRRINAIFAPLIGKCPPPARSRRFQLARRCFDWSVDLRYRRQVQGGDDAGVASTPLDTAGLAALIDDFESLYERKFGRGSAYREAGIGDDDVSG